MRQPAQRVRRARGVPWSRGLFVLAVAGPALALGGVHPQVVAVWLVVVAALLWRLSSRTKQPLACPWPAWLLAFLAGWTLLAAMPIPGVRSIAAPSIEAWVDGALVSTDVGSPWGLSVRPGDTIVEAARLLGLAGLVLAARQLSWRIAAFAVAACGIAVAGIGFVHALVGATKVFGLYASVHADLAGRSALLGTFINPNHQSGLLLLSLFSTGALALDQLRGAQTARDVGTGERRRDRGLALVGGLALLLPALLLSLSRGALLVLVILGPIGLLTAVLGRSSTGRSTLIRVRRGPLLLALLALLAVLFLVGRHGAWAEFSSLFENPSDAFDEKLGPTGEALGLMGRSPLLGTGRGTFIDLFGLHAPGADRLYTHLECTPVAALIEWGPVVGGAAILAALGWWVYALRSTPKAGATPRKLLLLGIAAVSLQSIVDFSLEFLGVAAPMLALVGALSPRGTRVVRRRGLRRVVPWLAVTAVLAIAWVMPHTWTQRAAANTRVADGELELAHALRWRPLDGTLHAVAARLALASGDTEAAAGHATFATRTVAGSVDAWLMLAEVHARRGNAAARDAAFANGLDRIRAPMSPALVEALLARYPDPVSVEAVTPQRRQPFVVVVRALREAGARDHADAMARARARSHPDDPVPLLVRSQIAAQRHNPALALHFALLARATDPRSGDAHLAVVRATAQHRGVDAGLAALDDASAAELPQRDRDRLDELRARLLLRRGDAGSLSAAKALTDRLQLRNADADTGARLRTLAKEIADASAPPADP